MKLRVNDEVIVIAGADKDHRGKILKIDRVKRKVIVDGAARVRKHVRKSAKNPQGGRLSKSMPMDVSNVMLIDPNTDQPTRVGIRYLDDGTKERYAKKSGKTISVISPPRKSYAKK